MRDNIVDIKIRVRRSYTLTKQSWKCILMRPAAKPGFLDTALFTALLTIASAEGQLVL